MYSRCHPTIPSCLYTCSRGFQLHHICLTSATAPRNSIIVTNIIIIIIQRERSPTIPSRHAGHAATAAGWFHKWRPHIASSGSRAETTTTQRNLKILQIIFVECRSSKALSVPWSFRPPALRLYTRSLARCIAAKESIINALVANGGGGGRRSARTTFGKDDYPVRLRLRLLCILNGPEIRKLDWSIIV